MPDAKPMMDRTYPPPFDLPVEIHEVDCRTPQPVPRDPDCLMIPEREWNRRLGAELLRAGCAAARGRGSGHCAETKDGRLDCREPRACQLPGIYKPFSEAQRRPFMRPIWLRSLERGAAATEHVLHLVLWGSRAVASRELALAALRRCGEVKRADRLYGGPAGGLAEAILGREPSVPPVLERIRVELITPFSSESLRKLDAPEPGFPLDLLLRSAARELAAWCLEDAGQVPEGGSYEAWLNAIEARAAATLDSVALSEVRVATWSPARVRSTGNRGEYRLAGLVGSFEARGNLTAALPWLAVAAIAGAGRRRLDGLGQIRISER